MMLMEKDDVAFKTWGNSEAIRFPKGMLKAAGYDENDKFKIRLLDENGQKVFRIEPALTKEDKLAILESLTGSIKVSDRLKHLDKQEIRDIRLKERYPEFYEDAD